jgi:hypothetical protein
MRCSEPLLHLRGPSPRSAGPGPGLVSTLRSLAQEKTMGKYVLGWLLGIPAVVLVAIYFLAH